MSFVKSLFQEHVMRVKQIFSPNQNSAATGERDLFPVELFYRSKVDSKMQTRLTAMFPLLSDCESCEGF